jgi:hypothetical protein
MMPARPTLLDFVLLLKWPPVLFAGALANLLLSQMQRSLANMERNLLFAKSLPFSTDKVIAELERDLTEMRKLVAETLDTEGA